MMIVKGAKEVMLLKTAKIVSIVIFVIIVKTVMVVYFVKTWKKNMAMCAICQRINGRNYQLKKKH